MKKLQMKTVDIIFLNISNGKGGHGSFLTNFAVTWGCADIYNKVLLFKAAKKLIKKYSLNEEEYKKAPSS